MRGAAAWGGARARMQANAHLCGARVGTARCKGNGAQGVGHQNRVVNEVQVLPGRRHGGQPRNPKLNNKARDVPEKGGHVPPSHGLIAKVPVKDKVVKAVHAQRGGGAVDGEREGPRGGEEGGVEMGGRGELAAVHGVQQGLGAGGGGGGSAQGEREEGGAQHFLCTRVRGVQGAKTSRVQTHSHTFCRVQLTHTLITEFSAFFFYLIPNGVLSSAKGDFPTTLGDWLAQRPT